DAWSMDILMNELLLFYSKGNKPSLRIQYKDYAAWQQSNLNGEGYWLNQFEGGLPELDLPFAKPRPAVKTYAGETIQKRLPENVSMALNALCLETGSTLFMGLLASMNALLYSYTHQEDIIIGTPIAGREHADLDDQVGLYINTLALRNRFSGEDSFEDLLSNVKQITLAAYEHQSYPFDELVQKLNIQRNPGRNALFDVMVVLQNTAPATMPATPAGLRITPLTEVRNPVSALDLTINFIEVGNGIIVNVEYSTDLFTRLAILRMIDDLQQLLETVTMDPAIALKQLIPSPKQKLPRKKQLIDDLEL
ncbi:MAG TPA: condensation domain-containing protein, partial [Chitinophagaceae bacterium]|nr:condensation domain-containing protein [Chitinophagaceae bacterium]